MVGRWWSPSEYSVCPRPLCWFYVDFTPVYVGRDGLSGTPVYVSVCQFTLVGRDVELDNKDKTRTRHRDKTQGQHRENTGTTQGQHRNKTRTRQGQERNKTVQKRFSGGG